MKTQADCHAEWNREKLRILERTIEINNDTPWSNVEPAWWLEMMEVQAIILKDSPPLNAGETLAP